MKTYKHLYEKLISDDNILLAINNASLGKRDRKLVKKILENKEYYTVFFRNICSNYYNHRHSGKVIYDGITRKKRTIYVPTHYEQVVHHMVVNVLIPIFMKSMYEHSYGSIPNRGAHLAKRRMEKWLKNDVENTRYCLKMDVKKYFDSIPHDILKKKISRIICDEDFKKILFTIIDVKDHGLPLGFYTSQWLANFYLSELDHHIKESIHAKYYVRYMDDMVILDGDKKRLHKMREEIEKYLNENLGLEMKKNWQIFRIEHVDENGRIHGRPLDFMGFKFYHDRTILRKNIMLRASRKSKRISKKSRMTVYDARQMLSYLGWFLSTDSYECFRKCIKPNVNMSALKAKISRYERRNNKCLS